MYPGLQCSTPLGVRIPGTPTASNIITQGATLGLLSRTLTFIAGVAFAGVAPYAVS